MAMLGLTAQRERHFVDRDGFVGCPIRDQDVDVERCMACPWFEGFEEEPTGVRAILCRVARPMLERMPV
jgi:hypothetical protein